jgi:hypothetical protein
VNRVELEMWRNTALGRRWYIDFDVQGREITKVVPGQRSFTLSTFARRVNQERVPDATADLFRNGNFVLVRATSETDMDEIDSKESRTDGELEVLSHEVLSGHVDVKTVLSELNSVTTITRLYEQFVLDDHASSVLSAIKAKLDDLGPKVQEREVAKARG